MEAINNNIKNVDAINYNMKYLLDIDCDVLIVSSKNDNYYAFFNQLNMTDESLESFLEMLERFKIKLDKLTIYGCKLLTDRSISKVKNVDCIDIVDNPNIGKSLGQLSGCDKFMIEKCPQVTDDVLKSLPKLEHLVLNQCHGFTDEGLACLNGKHIFIRSCQGITDKGVKELGEKMAIPEKDYLRLVRDLDPTGHNDMPQLYIMDNPQISPNCIQDLKKKFVLAY